MNATHNKRLSPTYNAEMNVYFFGSATYRTLNPTYAMPTPSPPPITDAKRQCHIQNNTNQSE